MKKYQAPEIKFDEIEIVDIITNSKDGDDDELEIFSNDAPSKDALI